MRHDKVQTDNENYAKKMNKNCETDHEIGRGAASSPSVDLNGDPNADLGVDPNCDPNANPNRSPRDELNVDPSADPNRAPDSDSAPAGAASAKNDEIKRENRKALKTYIPTLIRSEELV